MTVDPSARDRAEDSTALRDRLEDQQDAAVQAERASQLAEEVTEQDARKRLISVFEDVGLRGRALDVANWLSVVAGIWVLITAVSVIGDGFGLATGGEAENLFDFASNPLIALMIGLAGTALTQSSSTTTSITVGMVAGGLPLHIAIPILMGANLGTTMTNTLVSLGMIRDKDAFRRGFAVATVHDFFNLLAVFIILPLELMTGFLRRASEAVTAPMASADGSWLASGFEAVGDGIGFVKDPGADAIVFGTSLLPELWQGIALIVVGIALIMLVINFIGKMLKVLMVGQAQKVLHNAIGRGPVSGVTSGALMTVMVQSSSTTTALTVPLAGSGHFGLKQLYPFTVGANIGTTMTALIAAFAFTGAEGQLALQAALIHLFFSLSALVLIFCIPGLRNLPPMAAQTLADLSAERKIYAAVWTLGVFVVLPLSLISVSVML
ncbi:sodium:phosphate symporter [Nesterenkonia cremea]|uniref:Sodium:phosphate symporter n=1 Tax=Nesterenkonia cremea TaxID=1882340 RepID=A0A917ATE1_9MICC|nr:sodium:phosphate symporter [Nesterenkonia cremea]